MTFGLAFSFPFRGRNAWPNFGCALVCMLIPMVGPIVLGGFLVVAEKRLVENIHAECPRFVFGRFTDYLTRGIWPFLVSLAISFALMPVLMVDFFAGFLGALALQREPGWMAVVIAAAGIIYLGVMVLMMVITVPSMLRSGLEGSFAAGFRWSWLMDYWRRTGLLTLGTVVLVGLIALPVAVVSMCVPYLGVLAVILWIAFVQAHLATQLYLEYLQRGGTPIPFTPEAPEPAFPVVVDSADSV